ncbi:hypothetical protein C8R46DRAFT_1325030 [Mycena filopes]|nr:hypothetical protein C8R46DRAFT_1325030 [Mycena filopes]
MEYQLGLLARLTDEVRETDEEDSSVTQVIIKTAPFREKTLAFNYASLALNNSFFLGQLTPNSVDSHESAISDSLDRRIVAGSGSSWTNPGSTTILPTLGPGTLLVRSRSYMAEMTPNSTLYWPDMMPSPLAWDRDLKYVGKYLQDWGMDGRGNVPLPLDLKKLDNILSTEPPPPLPPTYEYGQQQRRQQHR